MKCHPLRWLWGLLPLAIWIWVTVLAERPRIEADLADRAERAVHAAGLSWANVNFAGRDGTLGGKATDDNETAEALRIASGVWGVRALEAQTELIKRVDTYLWSAARRENGAIRVTGYVPSLKVRKQIQDLIKAQFASSEIEDRTELARGAPPADAWISGIKFGLKQLAGLKTGHVDITGNEFSIAGEADTVPAYQGIRTALKSPAAGLKLVGERITPPVISPYSWAAQQNGGAAVLTGFVPSDKTRDEILAHAKPLFSKISDQMQLAEGAPEGYARAAKAALDQLAKLKGGKAELVNRDLSVSGEAADEGAADGVRKALKAAMPAAYKVADKIHFPAVAVAPPPPVDTGAQERERLAAQERKAAEEAEAKRLAAERERQAGERERQLALAKEQAEEARRQQEARERAAAKQAEAQKCQQTLRGIAKSGVILFERARADLKPESRSTLDKLAQAARGCPGYIIEVEGHTDAEGTPERNKALSERRASAVRTYLAEAGVEGDRLKAVGYGETQPVAPNDTPENRAKNRRIEFAVKAN